MQTPLYAEHVHEGARMIDFAGWDMPIQYRSIIEEHLAVRRHAGVFDVSHMGEFSFAGPLAQGFLDWLCSNRMSDLAVGLGRYSLLLDARGGVVDDVFVFRIEEEAYLMVVNAACLEGDRDHVLGARRSWLDANGYPETGLTFRDESQDWSLLAVQGPQALEELGRLEGAGPLLAGLRRNGIRQGTLAGYPVLFSRTGYTGEDGGEIYLRPDAALGLWRALRGLGIPAIGLGARNTLRLEAGFALYGHEWDRDHGPIGTPWAWAAKLEGRDCLGAGPARGRAANDGRIIGVVSERVPLREGYTVGVGGKPVGVVLSGTLSPSLGQGIGLVRITALLAPTAQLEVKVRNQEVTVQPHHLPFVAGSAHRPKI